MQKISKKPRHRILRWWPACFIFGFMAFLIAFTQVGTINVHGEPTGPYYTVKVTPSGGSSVTNEYAFTTLDDVCDKMSDAQNSDTAVEVQVYGLDSTLDLSGGDCNFKGNNYYNTKITFNNFAIHTSDQDTTGFYMKSNVGVGNPTFNSINFNGCSFDHYFQKSNAGANVNVLSDVSYIGCDFSEHFSYPGDNFGDLLFIDCTNVGIVNANCDNKMNASGGDSTLTVTGCTFTGNIQREGKSNYPRFQKDGSHAIVYGNGFKYINFHNNSWNTEEPISVDVYKASHPGAGALSNLSNPEGTRAYNNTQNVDITDVNNNPYVFFPVYSYYTTVDYYARNHYPGGSVLQKVNDEPIRVKLGEVLRYKESETLVSSIQTNDDHSEILTQISEDPSTYRTYQGVPYHFFTADTDPDYSEVSTKNQNNITASYDNGANRIHFNYVVDRDVYAEVFLTADVSLDGNVPPDGKITLILEDDEGNVIDTEQNKGSVVDFHPLSYIDAPGEYTLKMRAQVNPEDGIEGDGAVYTVKVKVTQTESGCDATVSYEKNGQEYEGIPLFEFKTLPAPIVAEATKVLTGDNANTAVWVAMLALSAICLICLAIYNKKKKENLAKNEK